MQIAEEKNSSSSLHSKPTEASNFQLKFNEFQLKSSFNTLGTNTSCKLENQYKLRVGGQIEPLTKLHVGH